MFVLCPHCHFLVGMDPRTGGPPATCPKCGGTVVEPVAATAPDAPPLDPFAEVALPSVAPTLPVPEAGMEAEPVATPAAADADAAVATEPAVAEPVLPEQAKAPVRPSADEMIAALATRAPRKPRAPRTRARKPAEPAPAAETKAATPPPNVATPSPGEAAPSAAASFGARLRKLFARAPRQPDAARPAEAAPAAPDTPPAAPADATPATPPLSIRNRRRRAVAQAAEPATDAATTAVAAVEPAPTEAAAPVGLPPASLAVAPAGELLAVAESPVDEATAPAATPAPEPEPGAPDHDGAGADAVPEAPADAMVAPPEPVDTVATVPVEAIASPRPAPSFARTHAPAAATRRDYRAAAAALVLAGLLGLQLLLAQRARLATDPGWRPTVAALCALLRCELPPWREPAAFTMLSRHVRPHPDAPGTLLIDASFRNDARWPQPWPRLELTLADVNGRTVGARSFEAVEYLGAAPTQTELAPGQSASLSLAVVEPAPDIVSFTFEFR